MMRRLSCHGSLLALLAGLVAFGVRDAGAAVVASRVEGETLIAANPTDPQAYEDFAAFYMASNDPEAAAAVLERGRAHAEPSADLLVALGAAYQRQKKWTKAELATRDALVLEEDHVLAHIQLGEIFIALGWPRAGLDSFRTAIDLAPRDTLAQVRVVRGLCEVGELDEAEETCLTFIAADQDHAGLWLALGRVFEAQGKRRDAFTTYGQVLTLNPESSEAWARQGKLFCEFGQYEAAAQSCRRALELNDDDALAHAYLAIALAHVGDSDEARHHALIAEAAGLNMMAVWKALDR